MTPALFWLPPGKSLLEPAATDSNELERLDDAREQFSSLPMWLAAASCHLD